MTAPRTRRQRGYQVKTPRSPDELAHAEHAQELLQILREDFHVEPERCVPTGDGKGFVRLTFDQLETLLYDDEDGPEDDAPEG